MGCGTESQKDNSGSDEEAPPAKRSCGKEYVGKAQEAKELKSIAGDKAGEEQKVVGAR